VVGVEHVASQIDMTILFGHPTGSPFAHHAALSHFEAGRLELFCVSWMPSAATLRVLDRINPLQAMTQRLSRRHFPPLVKAPKIQGRAGEFRRLLIRALGSGDDRLSNEANNWLMRTMTRECRRSRVTAVQAYEDCSLGQFVEAKRLGKACIYDMPIGYYHVEDIRKSLQALTEAGAQIQQEPKDVGGGKLTAIARDAAFSGWEAEASFMPTDPAEVASTLIEVAARYVDRLVTMAGPRIIVIDDLHWLDPSSVTMVELIVDATADHPLLVLAGTRPSGIPAWAERPEVERLDLQGLDEPETAQLATLIARAAVEADGVRSIHERTEGNPLFVSETVRAFLEDGTLEWRDGRVALVESGPPRVPVTLRAVLGARIDALDPAGREALGVASIIGITFRTDLIEQLLGDTLLPDTLDRIAEAALIRRGDSDDWRFAHALIRDAAYAGLLASRRRTLHARLADHLELQPRAAAPGQIAAHRVASCDRGVLASAESWLPHSWPLHSQSSVGVSQLQDSPSPRHRGPTWRSSRRLRRRSPTLRPRRRPPPRRSSRRRLARSKAPRPSAQSLTLSPPPSPWLRSGT
jgi:hypothetical protein